MLTPSGFSPANQIARPGLKDVPHSWAIRIPPDAILHFVTVLYRLVDATVVYFNAAIEKITDTATWRVV